jgi:hypothetical protein
MLDDGTGDWVAVLHCCSPGAQDKAAAVVVCLGFPVDFAGASQEGYSDCRVTVDFSSRRAALVAQHWYYSTGSSSTVGGVCRFVLSSHPVPTQPK